LIFLRSLRYRACAPGARAFFNTLSCQIWSNIQDEEFYLWQPLTVKKKQYEEEEDDVEDIDNYHDDVMLEDDDAYVS
jgi:hypothetical protein